MRLHYTTDPASSTVHPGMLPLMNRMAKILRQGGIDYPSLILQALNEMRAATVIDADAFTTALNGARVGMGLPLLVSAEGDIEAAVAEAVKLTREQLFASEQARLDERVRAAVEADRQERTPAGEVGGYEGDPPPPRGAKVRGGRS